MATLMIVMMMVVFVVVILAMMMMMVSFVDGRVGGDGDLVIVMLVIMAVLDYLTTLLVFRLSSVW